MRLESRSGWRSAKAQARHERRQRAAQGAERSIRDVYRRLASALHPDREPDPVERDRKTALMQRVNQANDARDLLALLSLQRELEQIDGADLARLADERLLHFNRVLKAQSATLTRQTDALIADFAHSLRRAPGDRALTPAIVLLSLIHI